MTNEIKRIPIIYCRVSSERQKREGSGLESQEQRCRQYCFENGYGEPEMVFKDSFTGQGDFMNRPAMRALLGYADDHPHKNFVVVFDDLKRFARDVEFHLKLRTAFRTRGLLPKCLNFSFDESPEGQYVEVILAAGAELERKQNKRQVIQKQKARLERGYWAFHAPKGYSMVMTEGGKLCLPNEFGAILKEGLEGFASKRFIRQIDLARFLQEKGFFSNKVAVERHLETTKSLLFNPFYAGYIEYVPWEVARIKGRHKPLISDAVFQTNLKRLAGEAKNGAVRQDVREEFALRGLVACAACGRSMTAYFSKSKTGKKHPYYSCQYKGCSMRSKTVRKSDIDDDFERLIARNKPKQALISIVAEMFEDLWKSELRGVENKSEKLLRRKEQLESDIRQLADESVATQNYIVKDQFKKRIEEKANELKEIDEKLGRKMNYSIPYRTSYDRVTGMIKSPYKTWAKGTAQQKQELFSFMFDDKIVYEHGKGYRTPEKSCLYKLFDRIEAGHTVDVEVRGIEPRSKKRLTRDLRGVFCLEIVETQSRKQTKSLHP